MPFEELNINKNKSESLESKNEVENNENESTSVEKAEAIKKLDSELLVLREEEKQKTSTELKEVRDYLYINVSKNEGTSSENIGESNEVEESPENQEIAAAKEIWRESAEEQFGIKNFNLENFKRTVFNNEAVSAARSAGKSWEYIVANQEDFVEGDSYDEATRSFEAMGELENEKPGSVKALNEKFGIDNFQRYPKEILLNQLEDSDPEKKVGLMVFAKDDWSGSFDDQKDVWSKIYNQQKEDVNFRIVECGTKIDLARQLIKSKQDFNQKISLLTLSAHSSEEGFSLSVKGDEFITVGKEDITDSQSMKEIFAPNAQLLANACSAGAIEGWVKDVSKEARIKAVGPDVPATIEDVDFVGSEIVPKYQDNNAYSGYQNGFLMSKKKV